MTEPTVVISLDMELSWGSFDHSWGDDLRKTARWTHDTGIPNLLGHLTRNNLCATWAIVGGMMRPSFPDVSHLPEVHYPHFQQPWFCHVPPSGNEADYPEWFGASLVEMIRKAEPKQEIGFHSFSHVLFGWPGMTRERAIAEFRECQRIARELDFSAASFVFPRNSIAYLNELRDAGFTCYRELDDIPFRFANRKLTSVFSVLADFAGLTPKTVEPSIKDGLISIPGSLMVRYAGGWRGLIPDSSRLRRLRKGLDQVRRNGGIFHVWFHPENLYARWPRVENVIARFLDELGTLVEKQEVRCLTMEQLASEFQSGAIKTGTAADAVK